MTTHAAGPSFETLHPTSFDVPRAIEAARARRTARRAAQAQSTKVRWIVAGIWTVAVALATALTVVATVS